MSILQSKEQVLNNVLYGYAIGYSSCCIKFFHTRQLDMSELMSIRERKLSGTGFICCPKCESDCSEDELVERINSKRMVNSDFPNNLGASDSLINPISEDDERVITHLSDEIIEELSPHINWDK